MDVQLHRYMYIYVRCTLYRSMIICLHVHINLLQKLINMSGKIHMETHVYHTGSLRKHDSFLFSCVFIQLFSQEVIMLFNPHVLNKTGRLKVYILNNPCRLKVNILFLSCFHIVQVSFCLFRLLLFLLQELVIQLVNSLSIKLGFSLAVC